VFLLLFRRPPLLLARLRRHRGGEDRRREPSFVLVIAMMALALVGSVGFGRRGDPNAPNADLTVIPTQAQNWVMHQDQSDSLDKA
jgi:hypothetical protein